jgi:hypothetical protein
LAFELVSCVIGDLQFEKEAVTGIAKPDRSAVDDLIKRVGLQHFRYHDLRHVWASWHVQSGTPLFALHELAGCETERMVRRYAHLSGEHLAPYAERMAEHLGTFWAQQPVDDNQKPRKKAATCHCFHGKNLVAKGGIEPPTHGFSV